jgi:C1A family cysteine protease
VKNQGYCGSCWAFSATEQIESDFWKASGTEVILAPQQITSCDKTAYGCGGGWTEHAYEYVIRAGGVETEADYPYVSGTTEVTEACVSNSTEYVVTIGGYETVSSSAAGESAMANYVASTGPLSVCLDAQSWNFYTGGILTKCGTTVDHCVQAVGLDTTGDTPYWIVRNSWGTNWGYEGYIYMEYGVNLCEIASDATYVTGAVAV